MPDRTGGLQFGRSSAAVALPPLTPPQQPRTPPPPPLLTQSDATGYAACADLSARLLGYQQRLQQGDQLALEDIMALASSQQLPFSSLLERDLLGDLLRQLGGPLAAMSLAAELLCRLVTPAAVEEFHPLLLPCVEPLLLCCTEHADLGV